MRTSPVHYIAPSAISIVPNCNGSANDLAVTISRGTKIKVYSPRADIDKTSNGEYQEWTLTGRNRRLADSTKPYTIYARLSALDNTAYLIFAPMTPQDGGEYMSAWTQAYSWVTTDGLYVFGKGSDWEEQRTKINCIFVRLGDVSLPDANNQRTVTLDTGILGTDQFNDEWALRPDELPLRIELGCTIGDEDAGPTPYVYWGQSIVLTAMLTEGWTGTDIKRFDHWEIIRNSGDADADDAWNYQQVEGEETLQPRQMTNGQITLNHARGAGDDFNGAVSVTFTILAVGHTADTLPREVLKTATINIMAETVEKYELSLSENIVSYDPQSQNYRPDGGVDVGIRATDQRGEVFDLTREQIANASLVAEYSSVGSNQWTALTFGGSSQEAATANIAKTAFALQQSVNVRLMRRITSDGQNVEENELSRTTIAFVRNGEDSKIREWIYRLNSNAGYDATTGTAGGTAVSGQTDGVDNCLLVDDFVPSGWSDDPMGVTQPGDVEWEAWRDYDDENHRWGVFHAPIIHNRYAEDAVTYDIVPSVGVINVDADGTVKTGDIEVRAFFIAGPNRTEIEFLPSIEGVSLLYTMQFSIDDGAWEDCVRLTIMDGNFSRLSYGIPAATVRMVGVGLSLRLKKKNDETILKEIPRINVVKDGKSGDAGHTIRTVQVFMMSNTQPPTPSGDSIPPSGWSLTPSRLDYSEVDPAWVSGDDTIVIPGNGQDNIIRRARVWFTTLEANERFLLSIIPSTEANYDFGAIGYVDTDLSSVTQSEIKTDSSRIAAKCSGLSGLSPVLTIAMPGRHFVDLCYAKDHSTSNNDDMVTFKIQFPTSSSIPIWMSVGTFDNGVLQGTWSVPQRWNGDNAPYNEHAYALSRSRTSHADGDLYQVNGERWFPSAPDPMPTHPYVWERIMHYTAAGVNDQTSYICLTGAVGAMGKLCYMAGEYREDVVYTSNGSQTVAVEVSGTNDTTDIYYLNDESNVVDGRHIGPTDSGQTIWVHGMSQYNLVRARYLFADFAQFGAAVVSGDWLISVHGTINGTAYEGEYTDPATYINGGDEKPTYFWFDPAYPNEDHAGKPQSDSGQWGADHHNFIPNYAVNLLTGDSYQNSAHVNGILTTPFQMISVESGGSWTPTLVATDKYRNFLYNVEGSNQQYWITLPDDIAYNGSQIKLCFRMTSESELGNAYSIFASQGSQSKIVGFRSESGKSHSSLLVSGTRVSTGGNDAYFVFTAIPCHADSSRVSWLLENYNPDIFAIE